MHSKNQNPHAHVCNLRSYPYHKYFWCSLALCHHKVKSHISTFIVHIQVSAAWCTVIFTQCVKLQKTNSLECWHSYHSHNDTAVLCACMHHTFTVYFNDSFPCTQHKSITLSSLVVSELPAVKQVSYSGTLTKLMKIKERAFITTCVAVAIISTPLLPKYTPVVILVGTGSDAFFPVRFWRMPERKRYIWWQSIPLIQCSLGNRILDVNNA